VNQLRRGYVFGFFAYAMWGFFPLYWKLVKPAGPIEILAHRIVWSALFVTVVLLVIGNWRFLRPLARRPRTLAGIVLAAVLIAINWGMYIYGVNSDHVVETSLGYFINPLVTVLLGVAVLRERLRPTQWTALVVGAVAVAVLTVDYGRLPWIALTLAVTFSLYGLVKKSLALPAAEGLFVESLALTAPALAYLGWLMAQNRSTFGHVRDPAAALRRGRQPDPAVRAGRASVPHADAAARLRRTDLPRAHAARPVGRVHAGVGGARPVHVGRHPQRPAALTRAGGHRGGGGCRNVKRRVNQGGALT
jgi:chloramphenicol-sensitive protein RarD